MGKTLVLRLYHLGAANRSVRADQLPELSERLTARNRRCRKANQANSGCVEHPLRNLEQAHADTRIETAVKNRTSGSLRHASNEDRTAMPGMPWIPQLTGIDAMGVISSSCTTRFVRIGAPASNAGAVQAEVTNHEHG